MQHEYWMCEADGANRSHGFKAPFKAFLPAVRDAHTVALSTNNQHLHDHLPEHSFACACVWAVCTQELSLLLRGAAYLSYTPDPSLQLALWQETIPLLRHVSVTPAPSATLARIEAESLTQIGWSVLVGLGIRPPRQWVAAWVGAMRRRCVDVSRGALAGRPGEQQRAADSVWGQARRTIRPLRAGRFLRS